MPKESHKVILVFSCYINRSRIFFLLNLPLFICPRTLMQEFKCLFYSYIVLLLCVSVCLFVCLLDCMSVCLCVCMTVCLFVCLSVCLYVCLSVCLAEVKHAF